jgi:hypothetical protein
MKRSLLINLAVSLSAVFLAVICMPAKADGRSKSKAVVFTDGEVDDMDSFIRLLLYSNDIDIKGLVYTSSEWHYAGDGKGTLFTSEMGGMASRYGARSELRWTGTKWMEQMIDEYAISWPSLIKNDPAYPSPEKLKSIVKIGNIDFEGEMSNNTDGSEYTKQLILDDDPAPIYMLIWGGTNTLARALKSIEDEYKCTDKWRDISRKVSDKVIIYAILDQDATYKKYVSVSWPDIRVIYNSAQFWAFAYQWVMAVPSELKAYMNGQWFKGNIKFGRGPLMSHYYLWGDGQIIEGDPEHTQGDLKAMEERNKRSAERRPSEGKIISQIPAIQQYDFISEGDSPSFFFLLDFGLRSLEDYSYGGLGGRFVKSQAHHNRWEDGKNITDYDKYTGRQESSYPQVRWIDVIQNDFAARAAWCINDYAHSNHVPVLRIVGKTDIKAKPGEKIKFSCKAKDPDGNALKYSWWQYVEAGSYPGEVGIKGSKGRKASLTVPTDAYSGQTIHVILQVSDNGKPSLCQFARIIVTVQ